MPDGILDFLGFAVGVAFALPVGLLGVLLAADGDLLGGGALLAVAVGMVAVEELVVSPRDLAVGAVQRAAGRVVEEPDDGD